MISDRVAVLNQGAIAAVGTVDELTRVKSRYAIGIEGNLAEELRLDIEGRAFRADYTAGSFTVEVRTHEDLNRLIDLVRSHGVLITSVTPVRASLEESFMNLVRPGGPS